MVCVNTHTMSITFTPEMLAILSPARRDEVLHAQADIIAVAMAKVKVTAEPVPVAEPVAVAVAVAEPVAVPEPEPEPVFVPLLFTHNGVTYLRYRMMQGNKSEWASGHLWYIKKGIRGIYIGELGDDGIINTETMEPDVSEFDVVAPEPASEPVAAPVAAPVPEPVRPSLSQVESDRRRAGLPMRPKTPARQNEKMPLSLAGTAIYSSAWDIRWDGKMIIKANKIAYTFRDIIYDSPTAVVRAHAASRGAQGASGWKWIRFTEGAYKGKTLAEYYDAEVA